MVSQQAAPNPRAHPPDLRTAGNPAVNCPGTPGRRGATDPARGLTLQMSATTEIPFESSRSLTHLQIDGTFGFLRTASRPDQRKNRLLCASLQKRGKGSATPNSRPHHSCLLYTSDAADEEDSVDL